MPRNLTVCVVDDEFHVRDSLELLLQVAGFDVIAFESARDFLKADIDDSNSCLLTDIRMPDMNGVQLQEELRRLERNIPVIVMTGHGDIPMAVEVMKLGAVDFLEKPFEKAMLLKSIGLARDALGRKPARSEIATRASHSVNKLTEREKEVLDLLVAGHPNKVVAHKLDISPRTVEVHRARIMEKMQARSLADLVRMMLDR